MLFLFYCPWILAYHVDDNRDIFFKEIPEGIITILLGTFSSFAEPLVIVGGNRKYIRFLLQCYGTVNFLNIINKYISIHIKNIYADMTVLVRKNCG